MKGFLVLLCVRQQRADWQKRITVQTTIMIIFDGRRKNRTVKSNKIEEQLKRTEARLQKTKEEKKALQTRKKLLAEQVENERLCSRGRILESFLREPLILNNEDISYLLNLMFRSSFSQNKLAELIAVRKPADFAQSEEVDDSGNTLEENHEQ